MTRKTTAGHNKTAGCERFLARDACHGSVYVLLGVLKIHEFAGEVLFVGGEVEVAVAAEVEQDHPLLPHFSRLQREVYRGLYSVVNFRRGDDALGPREEDARLEGRVLGVGARLYDPLGDERRDYRGVAMVA